MIVFTKNTNDESFQIIKCNQSSSIEKNNKNNPDIISIATSDDLTLEEDKSFTFTSSSSSSSHTNNNNRVQTPETANLPLREKLNSSMTNKSMKRISSTKAANTLQSIQSNKSSDDSNIKYKHINSELEPNSPQIMQLDEQKKCFKIIESPEQVYQTPSPQIATKLASSAEKQLRPSISCESFVSNDKEREDLKQHFPSEEIEISDIGHRSMVTSNSTLSLFTVTEGKGERSARRKKNPVNEIPNNKTIADQDKIKIDLLKSSINFKETLVHHKLRSHEYLIDNLNIIIRLLSFGRLTSCHQTAVIKAITCVFCRKPERYSAFLSQEESCSGQISEILEEFQIKCKAVTESLDEVSSLDKVKIDGDPFTNSFREDLIDFVFGIKNFEEKQALMNILIDQTNL